MQVGDRVYLKPVNNQARYIKNDILNHIKEAEVEKIGKKYFYLKGYSMKFGVTEMIDISNYCANYQVYTSLQEIKDEEEFDNLVSKIKSKFTTYGTIKLTLDQLRRIQAIIEE